MYIAWPSRLLNLVKRLGVIVLETLSFSECGWHKCLSVVQGTGCKRQ